jgi:hypothetical protein
MISLVNMKRDAPVQVHRNHMIHAGDMQHIRHNCKSSTLSRSMNARLAVIAPRSFFFLLCLLHVTRPKQQNAPVGEIRQNGRDAFCTRDFTRVDHNQQLP